MYAILNIGRLKSVKCTKDHLCSLQNGMHETGANREFDQSLLARLTALCPARSLPISWSQVSGKSWIWKGIKWLSSKEVEETGYKTEECHKTRLHQKLNDRKVFTLSFLKETITYITRLHKKRSSSRNGVDHIKSWRKENWHEQANCWKYNRKQRAQNTPCRLCRTWQKYHTLFALLMVLVLSKRNLTVDQP